MEPSCENKKGQAPYQQYDELMQAHSAKDDTVIHPRALDLAGCWLHCGLDGGQNLNQNGGLCTVCSITCPEPSPTKFALFGLYAGVCCCSGGNGCIALPGVWPLVQLYEYDEDKVLVTQSSFLA